MCAVEFIRYKFIGEDLPVLGTQDLINVVNGYTDLVSINKVIDKCNTVSYTAFRPLSLHLN